MKVGQSRSSILPITCGVPQGPILGPILFNIAINSLLNLFHDSFAYADDTLLICVATSIPEVLENTQTLLKEASTWYKNNLLTLNIAKTQFCIFSNRNLKNFYHIDHQSTKIESQFAINVLGVILDTDLSFKQ